MRGIQLREQPPRPNHQVMCKEKWHRLLISGGRQSNAKLEGKDKRKLYYTGCGLAEILN